jgi:two-component system CheB/CheR fusion protein
MAMSEASSSTSLRPDNDAGQPATLAQKLLFKFWDCTEDYACVLLDTQGIVIGWTGAASDVLGFEESEIIGRPISTIFTKEDKRLRLPELERKMAAGNGRAEDDRWHLRKDGARIWVSGALLAIRENDTVIGFAKVMRDRTDFKAELETLKSRNVSLQKALEGRDEAFAKITHEIRNALSPMKNAATLLQAEAGQAKLAHTILDRQLTVIESMARDLSEAARVSTGRFQVTRESIDVVGELVEIVNVARPQAAKKNLEVQVYVPDGRIAVFADRKRFHQIIFNLLDNAIKYTNESGHIWVKCIVESNEVMIKVEDDGIGISAELLPVIFDLFTQETPDHPAGGMGIGLALVKTLVEAHDGKLEVRSEGKGKGSEFAVRLPLLQVGD